MKYGIGQKVKVRNFQDMVREYGVELNGDILMGNFYFTREMKVFCGEECRIKNVYGDGTYQLDIEDSDDWYFTDQMLEDFDKKDEVVGLKAEIEKLKKENNILKQQLKRKK